MGASNKKSSMTKLCKNCKKLKKVQEFYIQANQKPESVCKICKKSIKKQKYHIKIKQSEVNSLLILVEIIFFSETSRIDEEISKIDKLLFKYRKKAKSIKNKALVA